jgi:hypothetical protein
MKFLCLIIDRTTKQTLKEYPAIEARDSYYAKHLAASLYIKETGIQYGWYADCLEL